MSVLIIQSSAERVQGLIQEFLSKDLSCELEVQEGGGFRALSKEEVDRDNIEVRGTVRESNDICQVDYTARPGRRIRSLSFFLWALTIATIAWILATVRPLGEIIQKGLWPGLIGELILVICFSGVLLFRWARLQARLESVEKRLADYLASYFRSQLEVIQGSRGNLISPGLDLLMVFSLLISFPVLFYFLGLLYFSVFAAFLTLHTLFPALIRILLHKDALAYWKLGIVQIVDSWCRIYETIIFVVLLLYYINIILFHLGQEYGPDTTFADLLTDIQRSTSALYDASVFERKSVDVVREDSLFLDKLGGRCL